MSFLGSYGMDLIVTPFQLNFVLEPIRDLTQVWQQRVKYARMFFWFHNKSTAFAIN